MADDTRFFSFEIEGWECVPEFLLHIFFYITLFAKKCNFKVELPLIEISYGTSSSLKETSS
ncbi:MAG: hypothetical protein KGD68_10045 [Candidatus Lokiarchaeota archaeon]|nr:hypothetical protein [Candidatus Lokiarchaeota archaeon]